MTSKNLMISCIESQYTAEYIANIFWKQNIAKVSNITLIPYLKDTEMYSVAYISIDQWCESEAAYNFIQRLKHSEREARIVHHADDWWPVEFNTHNNGNLEVGNYTIWFPSSYFVKEIEAEEDRHPIIGPEYDEYYTVDEALMRLIELNKDWDYAENEEERKDIESEMKHFENELRIHESVIQSANVTSRDYRRSFCENTFETAKFGKVKCI
jgi:hypothetical protein